ncbi:uncharacterized protein LOC127136177 [Lathyrus oleraceus]|uniref:uncharacterized protein LOC127136177 n=1 Tax=Pisum sativum TaxID=3888 RepID=UPI0021D1F14E|nr:uncharacterized protein LOC127136177 [Pisum sativum]
MPEEKECVDDITLNLVQPKNILVTLKRKRPENISNIKQVYNSQYQTNKALRGGRIKMQQLLKMLDNNSYVSRYRTCEDEVTVRDIFWTHPDSIKLFNMFPNVLILDSTERKDESVTWALKVCQAMLKDQDEMPKEIIINRNTALMNSVEKESVESTILDQVKEKIVCAWIDQVKHLRNTTTNRVESVHATLKNWLGNSKENLCRDWESVNQIIQNKHDEIKTSFG